MLAHGHRGIRNVLGDYSDELSPTLYHQLTRSFDLGEVVTLDPDQPDNRHRMRNPDNRQPRQSLTGMTDFGLR
ncbi:MAG: hypothetical protein CM1200mP2_29040 [Planctomycetaceae bacterium]|nr:MAG: hypothetical protein CM1200mP2_29040 [Planctomycetaceae bacterium]